MRKIDKKTVIKILPIVAAILFLVSVASVGAYAFLSSTADEITNRFVPAVVTCQVQENFAGGVKSDVAVKNTGNISAYIRVYVTVNWEKTEADNDTYMAETPVENVDYTLRASENGWVRGNDGFWYYTVAVLPEEVTQNVIDSVVLNVTPPEGCKLNVTVLASAIQAEPVSVVEEQWNVRIENGILAPN